MTTPIGDQGQPLIMHFFNAYSNRGRNIDELIGPAKGMVVNGNVNQAEAEFLVKWSN